MLLESLGNQAVEEAAKNVEEAAKSVEESASMMKSMLDQGIEWIVQKSGSLLIAIVFIAVGLKLVNVLSKVLKRSFERSKMETSVAGFLLSIVKVVGNALVFITSATILGFEVTSLVTILGTASLSIGLALQGALANLAGGVLILILKPFQVGDYIIENNKNNEGTVTSIDIFYTRLKTHDNKVVVIPNGILADNSLVNLTDETKRKVEVKISIAYNSDIKKVKEIVHRIMEEDKRILEGEPKDVFIDSFDDSGMTLGIRGWVETDHYWQVTWDLREKVKNAFDENGIEIPYNRLEVDLLKNE